MTTNVTDAKTSPDGIDEAAEASIIPGLMRAFGVTETNARLYIRRFKEAGLLPKAKRGPGNPSKFTKAQFALLVFGMMTGASAERAPRVAERVAGTTIVDSLLKTNNNGEEIESAYYLAAEDRGLPKSLAGKTALDALLGIVSTAERGVIKVQEIADRFEVLIIYGPYGDETAFGTVESLFVEKGAAGHSDKGRLIMREHVLDEPSLQVLFAPFRTSGKAA